MNNEISEEKLDKYIALTENKQLETANKYLEMAKSYLSDAKHFKEEGKWVDSFAAVNYAHAWLDAGAMQGLFDVGKDNKLFTVDPE